MDLTVVIVSFNTRQILIDCLESLYARTQEIAFETFVVDNGSKDGSPRAVREKFPDAILIQNSDNIGFSAANNIAIRRSRGRYVVLLNSDTLLIENCFLKLVRYMDERPEYSIITPRVYDGNDKLCSMRLWEDSPKDAFWRILGKYDAAGEYGRMGKPEPKEVETIGGSCFVARRSLFETIGLLDENYFLYNEEDDFCRRARRSGHKVCYFPDASIKHLHGKSTHQREVREKVIVETYKSNLYFYSKYYPPLWNCILRALYKFTFLAGAVHSLYNRLTGKSSEMADDSVSLKLKLFFMRVPKAGGSNVSGSSAVANGATEPLQDKSGFYR